MGARKRAGTSTFLEGTIILMAAGIITKGIGALFSIPLINIIGISGNAIYTIAFYVYSAMYIISTAGLPVAVSKMVAEANALGKHKEVRTIFKTSFKAFFVIGVVFTAVVIAGVDVILHFTTEDARYAILAIAPTIFFTCIVSAIRGYYQGLANMMPTAWSQIIESVGKLVVGLILAYYLSYRGYDIGIVVAGALIGVTVGTVFAAIYMIIICTRDIKRQDKDKQYASALASQQSTPSKVILKKLIKLAIPVTIGASVLTITNLLDMFLVMIRLQEGAMMTLPQAEFAYGAYNLAVKMFNMPQALIVGIGVSIIPAIVRSLVTSDKLKAQKLTESALRITGLTAFPCTVGLMVIPAGVLNLFWENVDGIEVAVPLLVEISLAIFLVAMVTVTNNTLQAMGYIYDPVRSMIIGGFIKLITNYVLVGNPGIGIHGAPIGTCLCYGTIMVLNLISIRKHGIKISLMRVFSRPLISACLMGIFAHLIFDPLYGMFGNTVAVLSTVALSAILYALLLIVTKALPKEDVLMLPKGEKIAAFLKMK